MGSVVVNDRLDEAAVVLEEEVHGRRDLVQPVEAVGDELFRRHPAPGDELGHPGHPQPAACAAHPFDGLVPIAEAPHLGGDGDGLAAEVGAEVDQGAPFFQEGEALAQLRLAAAAEDHPIHRAAVGRQDLLEVILVVVVHQVGGAIGLGHLEAALPGADGKDLPCPAEDRRPHRHKAHRADAQDCHRGPKGRVQLAHPLKGGAHHVRHHHCLLQGDPLGDVGQVHVRVPNIVLLHEGAAPLGIIYPGVEVVLALLAPAVLGLQTPPMGHDGADNHPVPHVEVLDLGPHFGDLAAHLVAHGLPHQIGQGGAPRGAPLCQAHDKKIIL